MSPVAALKVGSLLCRNLSGDGGRPDLSRTSRKRRSLAESDARASAVRSRCPDTRLKKSRLALDIFDELFRFPQADSCGQAIEFNGLKLVTSVEGINNLGGETLVRAKFDAGISHEEIELCFYPAQPSGPLSKIVNSARQQ